MVDLNGLTTLIYVDKYSQDRLRHLEGVIV